MRHIIRTDLDIDFLSISKPFVLLSTIAIILSLVGVFTKGLNYGIDFAGGIEVAVRVPHDWTISSVRSVVDDAHIRDAAVVQIGKPEDREFLVKVKAKSGDLNKAVVEVQNSLRGADRKGELEILRSDLVGPQAGSQLRMAAFIALFYASIGILIYIWMRFDSRFAPGIVRALILDMVIVLGIWVLLQKEFNLNIIAALLTIAGYSCNDTIVIYDRIREYTKLYPEWPLEKVINRSINQNLGRTVITIMCTLFVVVSLWIFGGPILSDFALAMMIGFVVSAYSTVFVANPMIVFMEKRLHTHTH